jgi:alkylation response protein AidB-like acyl-CoA dehydrogenase
LTYRAPLNDVVATLRHAAKFDTVRQAGAFTDLGDDDIAAVLQEAGKVAADVLAPLNRVGDTTGARIADGVVTTAPGWKEAYNTWRAGGWNGVAAPEQWGGQNLPKTLDAACMEFWNSANMAFTLGPVLSVGAVHALLDHGSDDLKRRYLPKLVSGEWMATMQLTEPQAGSDVGALRTRAERAPDGSYRITGQKIFITYGEHDLTDNIIHLVLARLPDAPPGTRGISLFLVPKYLLNPDGSRGKRNDVRAQAIEHKLGLHASPTCVMVLGDEGGATGYLIGEENRGMSCMFTMMNDARLATALQGVAIAERATQQAFAYAHDRKQGYAAGARETIAIIGHPDVKRMLAQMRALTAAARAICYSTAVALDIAANANDPETRKAAAERAAILTPIAKAHASDLGNEVASLAIQVHGGMGYIEETGVAQLYRDARIIPIYEGTNGIQAIDLVTRKLPLSGGKTVEAMIAEMRRTVTELKAANEPGFGTAPQQLAAAVDALNTATVWLLQKLEGEPTAALAGATPYLRLFGTALGGCKLADIALGTLRSGEAGTAPAYVAQTRFFAAHMATLAAGLAEAVMDGDAALDGAARVHG